MHNPHLSIDHPSKEELGFRQNSVDAQPVPNFCFTGRPDSEAWIETMINFAGILLAPDQIVEFLKHELQLRAICQQILHQRIIQQSATERGLTVSPAEIQAEADRVRYELRLESAARTQAWLTENLITPANWEAGICQRLLAQKLRSALFAQSVERSFIESRLDFEQITLYRIRVPYQALAQELFYQIEEAEISFYEAAHLYDIDEQRRLRCGYDGQMHRWDFEPELAAALFGASVGELLGPLKTEQSYDLLMVSEFLAAELTPDIEQMILERMFGEWLENELNYFMHVTNNQLDSHQENG